MRLDPLLQPLAIAVGACLGSALRHAADSNGRTLLGSLSPLARLLMTAAGSFVAGLLTADVFATTTFSPDDALRRIATLILIGALGGFVTFPGLATNGNGADSPATTGIRTFRMVSSLIVAVGFFITGARFMSMIDH